MNYQDRILRCRDCGNDFMFSAGEQEFFASKGYVHDPGRCPACRAAYRARQAGQASVRAGAAGRAPRVMHPVVCAQCGAQAEVPFVPRLDKPVYCAACLAEVRAHAGR